MKFSQQLGHTGYIWKMCADIFLRTYAVQSTVVSKELWHRVGLQQWWFPVPTEVVANDLWCDSSDVPVICMNYLGQVFLFPVKTCSVSQRISQDTCFRDLHTKPAGNVVSELHDQLPTSNTAPICLLAWIHAIKASSQDPLLNWVQWWLWIVLGLVRGQGPSEIPGCVHWQRRCIVYRSHTLLHLWHKKKN